MVTSSKANLFATSPIPVFAHSGGPLHGGASQAVLEMLEQIHRGGVATRAQNNPVASNYFDRIDHRLLDDRSDRNNDPMATPVILVRGEEMH